MPARLLVFALPTLLAAAATSNTTINSAAPIVTLKAGTLRGGICDENPQAAFFKSIPYAQPPVGSLRFASPQPLEQSQSSAEARDATIPPPACVQFGAAFVEDGKQSEDCLFMNVWKPANSTPTSKLPVRVWLYGGNDLSGGISDPTYDGCAVAEHDAIMVSINYRLGPLGFLALKGDSVNGNQAIEDILMALQWVQDNIGAFGGDPTKVMLHGQSSGAVDAFAIATLPQAPKLMNAVILQSGGGRHAPLPNVMLELGRDYAASANCSNKEVDCLRSKSAKDLQTAFDKLALQGNQERENLGLATVSAPAFGPYVDGKVIAKQPADEGVRVPAIFGSNSNEGTLFSLYQFHDKGIQSAQPSDYTQFLADNFGSQAKDVEKEYPVSRFNNTPAPAFYAISTVITQFNYLCPAQRGLNKALDQKQVDVWTYLFLQQPTCSWFPSIPADHLPLLGATHTAEIPFVFEITDHQPRPNGSCSMTTAERADAKFLSAAWTNMAKNGRPVLSERDWPRYTGSDNPIGLRVQGGTSTGAIDVEACKFWDRIYDIQVKEALSKAGLPATATTTTTGGSSSAAMATGGIATPSTTSTTASQSLSNASSDSLRNRARHALGMSALIVLAGAVLVSAVL